MALTLGLVAGCGGEVDEPPGSTFMGEVAAIEPLLAACAGMERTPAGRWCDIVRIRLRDCQHFLSVCPESDDCTVVSALACADRRVVERLDPTAADGWSYRHVSTAGWGVTARSGGAVDGGHDIEVTIDHPERAAWARWLPAKDPPAGNRLKLDGALLHLRYRPAGGLGISSDIGIESLADRLFSLRSDLFTAAVLSGDVELAVYPPDGHQLIPPVALAVDFDLRQPAVLAMEGFIEDLRQRYPLSRVDFELAGHTGACLTNLRVMPDLAPCYVATDDALVIGWNPASLELALVPVDADRERHSNRLELFFDRFEAADRRLATAHGRPDSRPMVYPWRSMRIVGRRASDSVLLDIDLEAGGVE